MKTILLPLVRISLLAMLTITAASSAAENPARADESRQLTSPDQVPEGLAKSDWHSIRAAYEAGRHAFQPVEGGWQARNPGQQWTTRFDKRGFLATPKTGDWTWGLELRAYGFGDHQKTIGGTPEVRADGQRLSYQWDDSVQEWFVNDQRGLEHGFTVSRRPAGADGATPLGFLIATRGNLSPKVSPDANAVLFLDDSGKTVLNYSGLKVWDADGKILSSRFEAAGELSIRLLVEERGAPYPLTIDPIAQQSYLRASNTESDDLFGISVSVSGDTVVIGASGEDSSTTGVNSTPDDNAGESGAAYVFVRNGATWSQQAYLKASNTGTNDNFGSSVSVSGDTLVVGASSESSGTIGVNSTPDDNSNGSGAGYVFVRSGGTWSQQAYLKASNTGENDSFGYSVAVSGDTVIVGALLEDSSSTGVNSTPNDSVGSSGAAYVFARSGGTWSQQAYLKASNTGANHRFGFAVSVSGDTAVVGASEEDSSATGVNSTPNEDANDSGAAYVFVRSGTSWSQQAYLKAFNTGEFDGFGESVSISGDTVVVGARFEDSSTSGVNSVPDENAAASGAAYVFVRSGTNWNQQAYLKASNTGEFDNFGRSVSVSGDTVVVGAWAEDSGTSGVNSIPDESASTSGATYAFLRSGTSWSQQAYLKAFNTERNHNFGRSVSVSGDTLVVGALGVESNSGAAYIFTGLDPASLPPAVSTATSSGVTGSTATLGGTVTGQGGASITGRGVVFSVASSNPNPLIGGSGVTQVATSGTTGAFTVGASGLVPSTNYSFKAYATNSNGTSYTGVATFSTPPYVLTTSAINGTIQRSPDLATYAAGTVVTLTAVPIGDAVFQGWTGDLSGSINPDSITMDGNKTVTAVFIPSLAGALEALDTPGRAYTGGGDANWFAQTVTTNDGEDALQSGVIGHSQQSWFETTVSGPGSLSYFWKVSSESGFDYLEFYIDGELQPGRISGSVDWTLRNHEINAGSHVLRWRYTKDSSDSLGSDAGWVDQIVWAPAGGFQASTSAAGLTGDDALPNATPFNDGVENLLKYAFNMNLAGSDVSSLQPGGSSGLPVGKLIKENGQTFWQIDYLARRSGELIYTPQKSGTLGVGSFGPLTGAVSEDIIDTEWKRVTVKEPYHPVTTPSNFIRVQVSFP